MLSEACQVLGNFAREDHCDSPVREHLVALLDVVLLLADRSVGCDTRREKHFEVRLHLSWTCEPLNGVASNCELFGDEATG